MLLSLVFQRPSERVNLQSFESVTAFFLLTLALDPSHNVLH